MKFCAFILMVLLNQVLGAQGPVALESEINQAALKKQKAISKIIQDCKLYSEKKDIKHRHLSQELLNAMGQSCTNPAPGQNLDLFMRDVEKVTDGVDEFKLWDDTSTIILEKSIQGFLALHMKVVKKDGKLTAQEAEDIICGQIQKMCGKKKPEFRVIQKSISDFLASQTKHPIPFLTGEKQSIFLKEFNRRVDLANETCSLAKKNYFLIKKAYSCIDPKTHKPFPRLVCDDQIKESLPKLKNLELMASESMALNMNFLIESDLGPLMATQNFRDKMGLSSLRYKYENCLTSSEPLLGRLSFEDVNKARSDLYRLTLADLKDIELKRFNKPHFINKPKEIQNYLKTNPLAISELLKRSPDLRYAKAVCSYIDDIHASDRIDQYVENGLIVASGVTSIAFLFATSGMGLTVLSPAVVTLTAISMGTTTIGISKHAYDYHQQLREDDRNRRSLASGQRDLSPGLTALNESDLKKEKLSNLINAGLVSLAYEGATSLVKYQQVNGIMRGLEQNPSVYQLMDGAGDGAKSKSLNVGMNLLSEVLRSLDPQTTVVLKNVSQDKMYTLGAIISKLNPAQGKIFIEKLSTLNAKKLSAFFDQIEKAGVANLSQEKLLLKVAHFSKTGKIHIPAPKIPLLRAPGLTNLEKGKTLAGPIASLIQEKAGKNADKIFSSLPKLSAGDLKVFKEEVNAGTWKWICD